MDKQDVKKTGKGKVATKAIAGNSSDPNFYGLLNVLPNPDEVLRKLGKTDEAYAAIMGDGHVQGELRSMRSGLLRYEWRLQAGGEQPADLHALELCDRFMNLAPVKDMTWADTMWNMGTAALRGRAVHEVVWQHRLIEGYTLPVKVVDRPLRRFIYNQDRECRLLTRSQNRDGIELPERSFLITRHMPSNQNPYGLALLSGCFWPYTFKHGGWKFFYKFCEKYGLPWAVGKHPRGTPQKEIDALVDSLANMVEDAVGAIPDDGSIELISFKGGGTLPQERLINMCNREMSKALTSQTLSTEIDGGGSRAAAETHRGREQDVQETDRDMICHTMNQLMAWITEVNVADAKPPTFEFYEEEEVQLQNAEFIEKARTLVDVPKEWAYRKMQVPMPKDGEEILSMSSGDNNPPIDKETNSNKVDFSAKDERSKDDLDAITEQAANAADKMIVDMAAPIRAALESSSDLPEFRASLLKMYPMMDDSRLAELNAQVLELGYLKGVEDAT